MIPSMSASSRLAEHRRWLYAAAWTPFLAIYAAAFAATGVPFGFALRNAVANVLPDAIAGLAVLRIPRRVPWPEGPRSGFFARQAAHLAAFVLAAGAGWIALVTLDGLLFEGVAGVRVPLRILPWRLFIDALVYAAVAGLAYAWRNAEVGRELATRAARAETLRARAELQALRSQLDPHFLLNTLHAVMGLVRRDAAVAEEALERLGDLLRYALRVHRDEVDEVALREEWSFVRSYLDLERLRLGDRLRVSFDAEPSALDAFLPSFALQILVENAVRHAIAPRPEGGEISIVARRAGERLRIEVADDGPSKSGPEPAESAGLGLRLLRERLAALYGAEASVVLRPREAGGVSAILDVPGATGGRNG